MSEPAARYQRSPAAMVGAMLIVLLAVVAFVVFRGVNRDNEPTPVKTVDYQGWVKTGRAEGTLLVAAPRALPKGWRATSVDYAGGGAPRWHLGLLTDAGKYVGVEESKALPSDLVEQYVDENATRVGPVALDATGLGDGRSWTAWKDAGGDYAVVSSKANDTVLVVGSAPPAAIRDFATSLSAR